MSAVERELRFHAGFEDQPALVFELRRSRRAVFELPVWAGFFDRLMSRQQTIDGQWRGLALHHHTCTGWADESPWRLEDVTGAREALAAVPPHAEDVPLHDALVALFDRAEADGLEVWIRDE